MAIPKKIKPFIANLQRLAVGQYLKTSEFKLDCLEHNFDDLWQSAYQEVLNKKTIFGDFDNTPDYEEALSLVLAALFNLPNQDHLIAFNEMLISGFAKYLKTPLDFNPVLNNLKEFSRNWENSEIFSSMISNIMKSKIDSNRINNNEVTSIDSFVDSQRLTDNKSNYGLKVSFEKFESTIDTIINKGEVLKGQTVETEDHYTQFLNLKNGWNQECYKILSDCLETNDEGILFGFKNCSLSYKIPESQMSLANVRTLKNELQAEIYYLKKIVQLLSVCDLFIHRQEINFKKREQFTFEEKELFLLEKLYQLYSNDDYFPTEVILRGNGISLRRKGEAYELLESLLNNGLVDRLDYDTSLSAQIIGEGIKYFESTLKSTSERVNESKSAIEKFYKRGFIIHGHDETNKLKVARFIDKDLSLEAIILHEKPNSGKTLIEKFEQNANVDFAVALWTADDLGKSKSESELKSRPRQNVIFETGFFIGKLGRSKVIVIYEEGIEIPSDYSGIVFIRLADNWKDKLRKELDALYLSIPSQRTVQQSYEFDANY